MGPTTQVIRRALARVGLASLGEAVGRSVNLILPVALLATEGAGDALDGFFLSLAAAFFVQGTLANIVTTALVPDLVRDNHPRSLGRFIGWTSFAGLLAGGIAALIAKEPRIDAVGLASAGCVAVMAASGLLAAPAAAALNAAHRYVMPGLTWGLRLLPLAVYLLWLEKPSLTMLLAGFALADGLRTAVLLRLARGRITLLQGGEPLRFPAAALHLILAAAVGGLSPLTARWIASLGEPGWVSLFEVADRLYTAVASLATIGTGGVILVYLARLTGTPEDEPGWRWILWTSLAWSLAWLSAAILVWAAIPQAAIWLAPQDAGVVASIRDTFLAFALGLPGLTMSGVLGRRLVTLGCSRSLIAIAAAGVACVAVVGTGLLTSLGMAGIALALTLGHYLAVALMFRQLRMIAPRCVS